MPFGRNPNFIGCEFQLDQLEEKLFNGTSKIAITGLGGAGKMIADARA